MKGASALLQVYRGLNKYSPTLIAYRLFRNQFNQFFSRVALNSFLQAKFIFECSS